MKDRGNRLREIERLNNAALSEQYEDRAYEKNNFLGYYNADKIRDALWSVDNVRLWKKIENCDDRKSSFCGSVYCRRCRKVIGGILESRVKGYIEQFNCTNDDLYMISGVIGLTDLSVREVERNIKSDGLKWKRIKRRLDKLNKKGFISVGYEFELVNGSFMFYGKGDKRYGSYDVNNEKENMFKRMQLEEISRDSNYFEDVDLRKLFLFNHFHGISNLDRDELKYVFGDEYFVNGVKLKKNSECGLYVRGFDKSKDLEDNVSKISGYGFKSAYRFKYNFIGSDYKNGEYFNNDELGRMISLYDEIKGRGYRSLFRNIDNLID